MLTHFCLVAWCSTQQMFEVEFNEPIGTIFLKKQTAVGVRVSKGGNQSLNGEITLEEEAFSGRNQLLFHQVRIAKHLPVGSPQHVLRMGLVLR